VISNDPFIDTPSCTTCDECTNKNNRMFAYDENKQAYIKDPDAGTYRELVEAAEVCQVAIIHPGKPRNQSEAGLDELIKRAEPFMA
jgi:ferredoxin